MSLVASSSSATGPNLVGPAREERVEEGGGQRRRPRRSRRHRGQNGESNRSSFSSDGEVAEIQKQGQKRGSGAERRESPMGGGGRRKVAKMGEGRKEGAGGGGGGTWRMSNSPDRRQQDGSRQKQQPKAPSNTTSFLMSDREERQNEEEGAEEQQQAAAGRPRCYSTRGRMIGTEIGDKIAVEGKAGGEEEEEQQDADFEMCLFTTAIERIESLSREEVNHELLLSDRDNRALVQRMTRMKENQQQLLKENEKLRELLKSNGIRVQDEGTKEVRREMKTDR